MKLKRVLHTLALLTTALALALGLWGMLPAGHALAATCTWTGAVSTAWETTGNWSGCQGGGTAPPANNDTVVIPDVTNDPVISTAATTGLNVTIQSGGALRNSSTGNIAFANFTIENGGTYIHDRTAALPGTTRTFGATSTVEFLRNTLNTCPVFADYGNLIINISNFTSNVGCGTNLRSVAGNLEIRNTSGHQLRLVSTQSTAHNVGGNLIIGGGTLVLASSTGSPVVTVSGDVSISAGTLDMGNSSGAPTLAIGGNFNQTGGTFQSSGSAVTTVAFTGGSPSATFATSGGTFTNSNVNWQIAAGKTVGLNTNFGGGGWVNASRTMTVNGAFQINEGAWPGNSGTWAYGAAGALVFNNTSSSYGVGNDNYWPASSGPVNVNVLGAGGITMNVARTVSGIFQTSAGVTNGNNLTLDGTAQINTGGWFGSAPVYGASSTLVYNPGGSYTIGNEWTTGGAAGSGVPQDVTIQNGTNVAIWSTAGTRTVPGTLTISSGSLTLGGAIGDDLAVGGNWINNGTFNANSRAVFFNGNTTVSGSSTTAFAYVLINGTLTAHATRMDVANNWTHNGTFNHNNGAVHFNGNTTIGGSSVSSFFDVFLEPYSTVVAPGGQMNVAGDWTNDGTFNANNGSVHFNGNTIIGGSSISSFFDVYLEVNSVVDVGSGSLPRVDGTLTNNGALRQTLSAPGSTATEFLHLRNTANTTDKYFGVTIEPSGNMGPTTVTVSGNQLCPNATVGVRRCVEIAPGTSQTATLTLYFTEAERNGQTLSELRIWHWDGSAWSLETGTTTTGGSGDAQWVQAADVSAYSPFSLSSGSPTAVTLASLAATSTVAPFAVLLVLGLAATVLAGVLLIRRRRR